MWNHNYLLFTGKAVIFGTTIEISLSKFIQNHKIVFLDFNFDLCDLWIDLTHEKSKCPIKPGHYNIHYHSVPLPKFLKQVRDAYYSVQV